MISFIFMLAATATSPSAVAESSATSEPVTLAENKPKKPKKICRTLDNVTGSRLIKRVCKTQEQWDQAEYAAELSVKGAQGTTQPPQFPTGG